MTSPTFNLNGDRSNADLAGCPLPSAHACPSCLWGIGVSRTQASPCRFTRPSRGLTSQMPGLVSFANSENLCQWPLCPSKTHPGFHRYHDVAREWSGSAPNRRLSAELPRDAMYIVTQLRADDITIVLRVRISEPIYIYVPG